MHDLSAFCLGGGHRLEIEPDLAGEYFRLFLNCQLGGELNYKTKIFLKNRKSRQKRPSNLTFHTGV